MLRQAVPRFAAVLVLLALIAGCASTGIGKAVQAADAQKQLVERAAVEFVKLKLKGDPRITPAVYDQARATYEKYQGAQAGLAEALSSWKVVSSQENENKLQAALTEVTRNINVYLALVGKFVDLEALKAKLKAGVEPEIKTAEAAPTWNEIIRSAGWEFQLVWEVR